MFLYVIAFDKYILILYGLSEVVGSVKPMRGIFKLFCYVFFDDWVK